MSDPTAWMDRALCANTDPELFFPMDRGGYQSKEHALRTCARCEVSASCLAFALENALDFGIYGGATAEQRKTMGRPRKERTSLALAGCGTAAGYRRHRRLGQEACPDCLRAERLRSKERRPPGTRAKRAAA